VILISSTEFFNFPHDFNPKSNYFLELIKEIAEEIDLQTPIHFYGCYPEIKIFRKVFLYLLSRTSNSNMTKWLNLQQGVVVPHNRNAFNIWCTYENRRPPVLGFDLTLSFELDDYKGTNYYLPLIYLYTNLSKKRNEYSKHKITPYECAQPRNLDENFFQNKSQFATSFINNPHPIRLRAINELSKVSPVNVYGRSVDNYVDDKIGTASKYWFNLCFENDLYPGYVTEKVLEAWLAGAIPLYWGIDKGRILNPEALINFNDFDSMETFVQHVSKVYSSPNEMKSIINQPLFLKIPEDGEIKDFLINGLRARAEQ